jgi:hypothetical protein
MAYKLAPKHLRRNEIVFDDSESNYIATDEEKWNPDSPPGGDDKNWFWTNATGWLFKGNAEDGTNNKSTYINEDGKRVFYDNIDATSLWDKELVDLQREMITGRGAWVKGGDGVLEAGMLYDAATNPFVRTQAEKDAQMAQYEQGLRDYQKRAEGGLSSAWNSAPVMPNFDDSAAYTGWSQFTDQGQGVRGAFSEVFEHDIDGVIRNFKSDWYNPFYGLNDNPLMIQRARELGNKTYGTQYENRIEDNAMDWLFNKAKDSGQRRGALKRFDNYVNENGRGALYTRGMDRALYNDMGMGDVLGEYSGPEEWINPNSARGMLTGAGGNQSGAAEMFRQGMSKPTRTSGPQRQGTWGSGLSSGGYSLFSEENEVMRDAIKNQLEKKLLG